MDPRGSWKLSDAQKAEAVRRYESGEPSTSIGKSFGVSGAAIRAILHQRNVKMRSGRDVWRLHYHDETAFDIITEPSAYWIGFMMADGCVREGKRGSWTVNLSLAEEDAYHIESFRTFLKTTAAITVGRKKRPESQPIHEITVSSKPLAEKLISYGVIPRKTHIAQVVGLENNRHFWRGVVDGDGCLGFSKPKLGRIKNPAPGFHLGGSQSLMQQFASFIENQLKIPMSVRPLKNIWQVAADHLQACKIAGLLYKDSTISLVRKYNTSQEFAVYLAGRIAAKHPYCSIPDCGRPRRCKGMCSMHYCRDQRSRGKRK